MPSQLASLVITLACECPLVLAGSTKGSGDWKKRVAAGLVPSLVTHPFAWHAIGKYGEHDFLAGYLLIESLVVVAESVAIRQLTRMTWQRAAALSLIANLCSALLGFLVWS